MPEMIHVDSTNVAAIGYDDGTQQLHVEFVAGTYYIYHGVPRNIFDALVAARSKGSFLNKEVKGAYRFTRQ